MRKLPVILCLLMCFLGSYAQKDSVQDPQELKYDESSKLQPVSFDEKEIDEYKSSKEFEYIKQLEEDSWWTRFKRWLDDKIKSLLHWMFGEYEANSFVVMFLKALPYILLAGLIGLIIWLFTKLNPGHSFLEEAGAPRVFNSEEEEIIHSKDIDQLIEEALRNGHLRLGIRYYYLKLLQLMDETGFIEYQFQKTNEDYSIEIHSEEIRSHFKRISRIYDYIWYGDFKISLEEFQLAQKSFEQMQTNLNRHSNE